MHGRAMDAMNDVRTLHDSDNSILSPLHHNAFYIQFLKVAIVPIIGLSSPHDFPSVP